MSKYLYRKSTTRHFGFHTSATNAGRLLRSRDAGAWTALRPAPLLLSALCPDPCLLSSPPPCLSTRPTTSTALLPTFCQRSSARLFPTLFICRRAASFLSHLLARQLLLRLHLTAHRGPDWFRYIPRALLVPVPRRDSLASSLALRPIFLLSNVVRATGLIALSGAPSPSAFAQVFRWSHSFDYLISTGLPTIIDDCQSSAIGEWAEALSARQRRFTDYSSINPPPTTIPPGPRDKNSSLRQHACACGALSELPAHHQTPTEDILRPRFPPNSDQPRNNSGRCAEWTAHWGQALAKQQLSQSCVGYDPITKKEIPRSYVFYLETRVEQLEKLLSSNTIPYPPAENLELCSRPSADALPRDSGSANGAPSGQALNSARNESLAAKKEGQSPAMMNLVGASKPKSLASASGVSFARVVFAAVQYSVSDQHGPTERTGGGAGTSMRDSFFGLHARPTIQPAPFPDRQVGMRLVTLYFEHANPQIPILHRGEFMQMFEQAYANSPESLASRELYMLNMVFAIGCGVIVGEPVKTEASGAAKVASQQGKGQCEPEEYHASAIVHLESCLSFSGGGLEVLQAVLLLANFALLRPVPPGLWYITGVAVRLAVDLGLHYEEGGEAENSGPEDLTTEQDSSVKERGRRQYVRDMRRRLWWCTYSFDRLVSTCVGRPFGVSDQVITTELPSVLDDDYVTPTGFVDPPVDDERPSYKHVAHHYFRLRMLQSEILQVLQYNQAQLARQGNQVPCYPEMRNHIPSPFLVKFDSFRSWRSDIDERLYHWKSSAPTRQETGVAFSTEFLELNYWQAIIMLYRQSLSVPAMFEGEYNTSNEVNSPTAFTAELREDEDRIYLKVAEAGQKILRIYRQLHLSGLVSYTYLSTHHLFMAGISYLYAIWHSPLVRSRLSMDEVDFTVLAAKSVFTDMIDKCPPAETCRDAFDRTAKATIKMASSNGGFGTTNPRPRRQRRETTTWITAPVPEIPTMKPATRHRTQASDGQSYQFDLAMGDNISSPGVSAGGDVSAQTTPPLSKTKAFDSDSLMAEARRHSGPSPADGSVSQDGSSIDPLVQSPPLPRRMTTQGGNNTFMGQQFGMQGSMDYPDSQTMEFLQTLGATPNGDFSTVDQAQLDLGFGINWEGMHNDFSEGGHINPFDTFFFGGQPNGGSNNNGNNGNSGNGPGGGMSM